MANYSLDDDSGGPETPTNFTDGRYEAPKDGGYRYRQTQTYRLWKIMKASGNHDPAWENFDQFKADMGTRPDRHFLSKIDETLPWSKTNTKWITPEERQKWVKAHAKPRIKPNSIAGKARDLGMQYHTLYMRLKVRGWTEYDAMTKPVVKRTTKDLET